MVKRASRGRSAAQIAAQHKAAKASAAARSRASTGYHASFVARKKAAKEELGRATVRKAVNTTPNPALKSSASSPSSPMRAHDAPGLGKMAAMRKDRQADRAAGSGFTFRGGPSPAMKLPKDMRNKMRAARIRDVARGIQRKSVRWQ